MLGLSGGRNAVICSGVIPLACGCHTVQGPAGCWDTMWGRGGVHPKRCLGLGLLLSSLFHQLVKQILMQHPWAPGGVGEWGNPWGKGTSFPRSVLVPFRQLSSPRVC